MGMYESHAFSTYKIPQKLYNYLLPIYGICAPKQKANICERSNGFYFVGSKIDYTEMLQRSEFFRIDENIDLTTIKNI